MLRQMIASAIVAVPVMSFAADSEKFTANIAVKVVADGETTEIKSKLNGGHGQTLKRKVGSKNNTTCKVTIVDIAGTNPRQYVAAFRMTKGDGVISTPTITTLVGKSAQIFIGEEEGDQIKIDLVVRDKRQ